MAHAGGLLKTTEYQQLHKVHPGSSLTEIDSFDQSFVESPFLKYSEVKLHSQHTMQVHCSAHCMIACNSCAFITECFDGHTLKIYI